MDGGHRFFDGAPIFGSHKTIRGLLAGIIAGSIVGLIESVWLMDPILALGGLMVALGAVLGDLAGAFIKRRLKIEPGKSLPILDQLDFVLGGLGLGLLFIPLSFLSILIVLLITPPIHIGTNYGAHRLGLTKGHW